MIEERRWEKGVNVRVHEFIYMTRVDRIPLIAFDKADGSNMLQQDVLLLGVIQMTSLAAAAAIARFRPAFIILFFRIK